MIRGANLGADAVHMTHPQIADDLAARIAAGDLVPGEQLPTYDALAEAYGVSRDTIKRALGLLRARGLVVGVGGVGVWVAGRDTPPAG